MPPALLTAAKYASDACPTAPATETGPLYGIVWPSLISVPEAPGSYGCAVAELAARTSIAKMARSSLPCIWNAPPARRGLRRHRYGQWSCGRFNWSIPRVTRHAAAIDEADLIEIQEQSDAVTADLEVIPVSFDVDSPSPNSPWPGSSRLDRAMTVKRGTSIFRRVCIRSAAALRRSDRSRSARLCR